MQNCHNCVYCFSPSISSPLVAKSLCQSPLYYYVLYYYILFCSTLLAAIEKLKMSIARDNAPIFSFFFSPQWMCIPFAWANPKVQSLSSMDVDWIGKVKPEEYWFYVDYGLLLIFGGIPWQVYFQRVLSSKTAGRAQVLSYVAALGCILMAIPPVLIGAIAKATREYITYLILSANYAHFERDRCKIEREH